MNRSFSSVSISIGIADDDRQPAIPLRQGETAFSRATDSGTNSTTEAGIDDLVEVDVVQAVLLGHRPHDLFAGGVAEADQGVGQLDARFLGHLLGFGQLVGADDLLADEDFGVIALLSGGHEWLHGCAPKMDFPNTLS